MGDNFVGVEIFISKFAMQTSYLYLVRVLRGLILDEEARLVFCACSGNFKTPKKLCVNFSEYFI